MRLTLVVLAACGRLEFVPVPSDTTTRPCDPLEVRVTTAAGDSTEPTMVWTGDHFVVCWTDKRGGPDGETYCRLVDDRGQPLGPELKPLAGSAYTPDLLWTGSEIILAFTDNRDGDYDIYLAPFDANLNRLGPDLELSTTTGVAWAPSLAQFGGEIGVAWYDARDGGTDQYEVYAAHVDANASTILGEVRVTIGAGPSFDPILVPLADGYGVTWWDGRQGVWDVMYTHLSPALVEQGDDRLAEMETQQATEPSMTRYGNELGIVYRVEDSTVQHRVAFSRQDSDGVPLAAVEYLSPVAGSDTGQPTITTVDDGYAIAWNTDDAVWLRAVDAAPVAVSRGIPQQRPRLVARGRDVALVWQDQRDGQRSILATCAGSRAAARGCADLRAGAVLVRSSSRRLSVATNRS